MEREGGGNTLTKGRRGAVRYNIPRKYFPSILAPNSCQSSAIGRKDKLGKEGKWAGA